MLSKNEIIPLKIESVSNDGNGVGRFDGMAVFVPMTAAGDYIEAKIVKVAKTHAFGIIDNIITPSPHRIENDCPVYRRCGGCALRHIDYGEEMRVKSGWVAESLRRIGGVDIRLDEPLPSPGISRYRNKAQYPVRQIGGKIYAGFFAKRSHELVPVRDCPLQPECFGNIANEIVSFLEEFGIEAYDEASHTGVLRHIFLRQAKATGEIMLCLIINAPQLPRSDALLTRISEKYPAVKTVVINENRLKTNVIFGKKTYALSGPGFIMDELCGVSVRLSAQSFYQVNRKAAARLYRAALEYASPSPDDTLLDLYCGTGTIGLSMAHAVKRVVGVEIVGEAAKDAIQNAAQNGIANARFICADAYEAAGMLKNEGIRPDIIIVDPPRKGIDEMLPSLIAELAPKKLVYISCNPATLARDIARLETFGFKLVKARAADLFPRAAHVECVALLSRAVAGNTL